MLYGEITESTPRVGLFPLVLNVQSGMLETWFPLNVVWWYQAMNTTAVHLLKGVGTYE